jgi:hypothetical protein
MDISRTAITAISLPSFKRPGDTNRENCGNRNLRPIDSDVCGASNQIFGMETMETLSGRPNCKKNRCGDFGDVVLESKDYCLDHFIDHCYECLEMFEPLIRAHSMEPEQTLAARKFLQECSNRAVVVCFCHAELTHADRPRLLQILLWSEDLQRLLRSPGNHPTALTPQFNSVRC